MRNLTPPTGASLLPSSDAGDPEANELVSTVLHDTLAALRAAGNAGASYDAIGKRCGVPRQHVNEWCNPGYERTPKLTRIVRMGSTIGPAVLRALAAKLEARAGHRDVRDAALGVQEAAGVVARSVRETLADGVILDAEERSLEAALLAAEAEIAATRAAIASHRARAAR